MTRTGPASLTIGVGIVSIDGPIATESSLVIAGGEDDDGPWADVAEVVVAGSLLDDDKGSIDFSDADIAAFDDSAGFVFSFVIPDVAVVVGKLESMGEVVGIETSLRRPCEPAPFPIEASRSLISTGILDCGCELDRGSVCGVP